MIAVEPLEDSVEADAVSVIVDPVGASSGTLSQALDRISVPATATHRREQGLRDNINGTCILRR